MGLDVLTACAINGVLTPARALARLGLIEGLDVPRAVLDLQHG